MVTTAQFLLQQPFDVDQNNRFYLRQHAFGQRFLEIFLIPHQNPQCGLNFFALAFSITNRLLF